MRNTPRRDLQDRIYEFIVAYMSREGMPPINREIGKAMGLSSTSHVDHYLTMLEKRRLILLIRDQARGIKLTWPTGIPTTGAIAAGTPLDIFPDVPESFL